MTDTAPKLVLVVEDDDAVRSSVCLLLEALGYAVRAFRNAEEFLAATDGQEADCLLLDYHLTGMSGMDLLELLRQRHPGPPAIMITANGKGLAARVEKVGSALLLKKPIAGQALAQYLDALIAKE